MKLHSFRKRYRIVMILNHKRRKQILNLGCYFPYHLFVHSVGGKGIGRVSLCREKMDLSILGSYTDFHEL